MKIQKVTIDVPVFEGFEFVSLEYNINESAVDEECLSEIGDGVSLFSDIAFAYVKLPPKRWRAPNCERYEFLNSVGQTEITIDSLHPVDHKRYSLGNYYKPGTGQAKKAAAALPDFFEQFHNEEER